MKSSTEFTDDDYNKIVTFVETFFDLVKDQSTAIKLVCLSTILEQIFPETKLSKEKYINTICMILMETIKE